jgi:hypothetical protein
MPATRYRLTAAMVQDIAERIKVGAFEQVAVESVGVPFEIYKRWLASGRAKKAPALYRQLADAVMQAKAHARFAAEMDLRKKDAKAWLLHGPGRESPGGAGWSATTKPGSGDTANEGPALQDVLAALLAALAPFPEARIAAATALEALKPKAESEE